MPFQRDTPYNDLPPLPPPGVIETAAVLKAALRAGRALAELKGYCQTLPEPELLLQAVALQESKDSSEIENIVTTQDELYQAAAVPDEWTSGVSHPTKEVLRYREAMRLSWQLLQQTGLLTSNTLIRIMQQLKDTQEGVRRLPGTALLNAKTGAVIYTPPAGEAVIRDKLQALEVFLHDESELDPLVRMALVHYQFEAIHPFADGNGRTGRILNVLYLVQQDLLTLPVLYLSGYILQHKDDYYRCLRQVTEEGRWEEWIVYMLQAVESTAHDTLARVTALQHLRQHTYDQVKAHLKTAPARELSDLMVSYPYLKIRTLASIDITRRQTAADYLRTLAEHGMLRAVKVGRDLYYINDALVDLFSRGR